MGTVRRKRGLQTLALWQVYLFVSLSFVIPGAFAQADTQPPTVQLDAVAAKTNSTVLTLHGTTNEQITVQYTVTINGVAQTSPPQRFNTNAGEFTVNPALQNGDNVIDFTFTDSSGNAATAQRTTRVDTTQLQILEHNLDQLDPTYSQAVTIRGKVSKPGAKVVVFVNGKSNSDGSWSTSLIDAIKHLGSIVQGNRDYSAVADAQGYFSIEVMLEQTLSERQQQSSIPGGVPIDNAGRNTQQYSTRPNDQVNSPFREDRAFENTVKIVAVDEFSHTAQAEGVVRFAKCGSGGDWNIKVSKISPAIITPELLRLGLAQFAFNVELQYQGSDQSAAELTTPPLIRTYEVNDEILKSSAIDPRKLISAGSIVPHWDQDDGYRNGFVVVNLNAHNYSQQDLGKLKAKDLRIKVPMQMELNYQGASFGGERYTLTQRQCWDVNLGLDIEVPLDKIPKQLLNQSIQAIDAAMNVIDAILKPLKVVAIVTLVGCITSWFVLFLARVKEKFQCNPLLNASFSGDKAKQQQQCTDAKQHRIKMEHYMKLICDRTFCPSVPSVSYAMRTSAYPACREYSVYSFLDYNAEQVQSQSRKFFEDNAVDMKEFSGVGGEHAKLDVNDPALSTALAGPAGAQGTLCLYDYMNTWDTACMMMNEFEQSRCAETNQKEYCPKGIKQVANRFAGFCGKDVKKSNEQAVCTSGGRVGDNGVCYYQDSLGNWYAATEVRQTQLENGKIKGSSEQAVGITNAPTANGGSTVYYDTFGSVVDGKPTDGTGVLGVHRGYAYQSPVYRGEGRLLVRSGEYDPSTKHQIGGRDTYLWKNGENVRIAENGQTYVYTADCGAVDEERCWVAASLSDPTYWGNWRPYQYIAGVDGTKVDNDGKNIGLRPPTQAQSQNPTNQNYIAQPSSGFIRSLQCVCLPAITGYLTLWRNILEQVKLCFQTILLTGQGKSGVCRAVLTQYVCDLIIDAIKCFVRKYGPSNERAKTGMGSSRLIGALNDAGRDTYDSITGRYGKSNLYQAMFNERKLIHQACLFAFTGDYDLDIDALLSTGQGVPIKSEGFLFPHTRRFLNYNPLDGRASFVYHVGVGLAAGAPLTYSVELICSNDVSCNPQDGFSGGRCDCYGAAERSIPITGSFESLGQPGALPGQLAAGQVLGGEQGDIYKLINEPIRYDKVRLSWTWNDNGNMKTEKIEKKIGQDGGMPPVECQYEITSLSFQCRTVIGRRGTARFIAPPTADKQYYYLGDKIRLSFLAEKMSPGATESQPSSNPIPKLVCYEVKSDSRAGKYTINDPKNPQCFFVQQDGQFDETSPGIAGRFTELVVQQPDIVGYSGVPYYTTNLREVNAAWNDDAHGDYPSCAKISEIAAVPNGRRIDFDSLLARIEPGTSSAKLVFAYKDGKFVAYNGQDVGDDLCIPKSSGVVAGQRGVAEITGAAIIPITGMSVIRPADVWSPAHANSYNAENRGSGEIDMVVIHRIDNTVQSALNWWKNPSSQVSPHYLITKEGNVIQLVRDQDIAKHAGNYAYNERSIGIEHEPSSTSPVRYNDITYRISAQLTQWLSTQYGIPLDRQHIIGHNEVPDPNHPGLTGGANNHVDPEQWDWNKYMQLLQTAPPSSPQPTPIYNTAFLTDNELTDYQSLNENQIRGFLVRENSYFKEPVQDVDGVSFDAAAVIAQVAQQHHINPKVLLVTLQKESSSLSTATRPPDNLMRQLMGCGNPSTARDQLRCAAERMQSYYDQLTSNSVTISGWKVNTAKQTSDGVLVTPATKAVAVQFTYTPFVGQVWGGNQPVGGVALFDNLWNRYNWAITPVPPTTLPPGTTPPTTPPVTPPGTPPVTPPTLPTQRIVVYNGFHIKVDMPTSGFQSGDWFAFRYTAPEGTTGSGPGSVTCDDFSSKGKAADWSVVVSLMNPKPLDQNQQLSATNYDPNPAHNDGILSYQGKKQEYTVPIKVVCADSSAAEADECVTNKRVATACSCGDNTCDAGKVCIIDPTNGDRSCETFKECPKTGIITASDTAGALCDCDGSPLNDLECSIGSTCTLTSSRGYVCQVPSTRTATGVGTT